MLRVNAILFDFDGVVIDSEPVHAKAKKLTFEKFNIGYPETIFDDYKGKPDNVFFDYVAGSLDKNKHSSEMLHTYKKRVFETIIKEIKLIDGFILFLNTVKSKGIKTALVSSTSLYSLGLVDEIYHISGMFDLVITEVDTALHKPHPDPYLKALEKLPSDILDLEYIFSDAS